VASQTIYNIKRKEMEKRKLKIVGTTWHVMHQTRIFDALKDDADFYLIHNSWRSWQRKEFQDARPLPENVKFVSAYEPGKYDFAILHIDQQAVNTSIHKGQIYREFNNTIQDIPKVVINHGSPVYPEYCKEVGMTDKEAESIVRADIRSMVKGNKMVVNSHKAAEMWGWGYPIVHGMKTDQFYDLPKHPRVFTALSPGGLDDYYNRHTMNKVMNILDQEYGRTALWAKINCNQGGDFENYKNIMGSSLLYLDTSIKTPMNSARTEAMLSGCCVVQVEGAHDLERFAKDGENMVLVKNDPESIASVCMDLMGERYEEAVKIGQAGKKMAQERFCPEKLREQWLAFIKDELKLNV